MKDRQFIKTANVLKKTIAKLRALPQTEQVKKLLYLHEEALTVVNSMDGSNPASMSYAKKRLVDISALIAVTAENQLSMN